VGRPGNQPGVKEEGKSSAELSAFLFFLKKKCSAQKELIVRELCGEIGCFGG